MLNKLFLTILVSISVINLFAGCLGPPKEQVPKSNQTIRLSLVSYSYYVDSKGCFHFVGEIENDTSTNTAQNKVIVTFFDTNGSALIKKETSTYIDIIRPNQKAPFEIALSEYPSNLDFKLETRSTPTVVQPPNIVVISEAHITKNSVGWGLLEGELKNNSSQEIKYINVIASFYDSAGRIVGTNYAAAIAKVTDPNLYQFMMAIDPVLQSALESYSIQLVVMLRN